MKKSIQKHSIMSNVSLRMYHYVLSLYTQALKNNDPEQAKRLKLEAEEHIYKSQHHDLMLSSCGDVFVIGR